MRFGSSSSNRESGLTLVELMVAVGLSGLLLATVMMLASFSARSFLAIGNYVALDQASRRALDDLTLKVREADGVIACTTNRLDLSYQAATLTYQYDPSAKTLSKIWNGTTTKMLEGCEKLRFQPYQRNPVGGTYDQYEATFAADVAKIVQVSWVCTKKAMGGLVNSESVQSAKIVIRKQ
jgi:Tfp pilus assembly protein PilW